jgi:hypothetical protein
MSTQTKVISVLLAASLLDSCSKLKVDYMPPFSSEQQPLRGSFVYALPMTSITVTGTVTLNDCDRIIANEPAPSADLPLDADAPPIDIAENLSISAVSVADRTQRYAIPVEELRSWTKQINVTVATTPNKALQNINSAMTDQIGPAVLATVQAVIAVAGAVAVPAAAPLTMKQLATADTFALASTKFGSTKAYKYIKSHPREHFKPAVLQQKFNISPAFLQALQNAAHEVSPPQVKTPAPLQVCNSDVDAALHEITDQDAVIQKYLAKSSAQHPTTGGTAAPTPPAQDPHIVRAQARIAQIIAQYHLARQFSYTWTPSRTDRDPTSSGTSLSYYRNSRSHLDLFNSIVAPAWLSDSGKVAIASAKSGDQLWAAQQKLVPAIELLIATQTWTGGTQYPEEKYVSPMPPITSVPKLQVGGIVVRDPALGVLRTCLGTCRGQLASSQQNADIGENSDPDANMGFRPISGADDPNNSYIEVTQDIAPALPVQLPQFGRVVIQPLKNGLFETSSVSVALNADGSIASVGNQDSSALSGSTGLGAVTSAANAEASAIAARNTAVGAQNTAIMNAASLVDTVNKNLADCLTQQAAILKAGGRPIGSCQ